MFSVIAMSWFLSFGYIPQQDVAMAGRIERTDPNLCATKAEVGLDFQFDALSLYGSVATYQYVGDGVNCYPYRADYTVGARYVLNSYITFSAEHECDHPVIYATDLKPTMTYLSQTTTISVKISGKTLFRD